MNDPTLLAALQSEFHIWTAVPNAIGAKQLATQYLPLFDAEECKRYQRFHFDDDRLHYLAAHALLRQVLSSYAPFRPEQWRFMRGAYGKPEIASAPGLPPLHFNLSHTRGMVACIVAYDCPCGIDVEEIRPIKDFRPVVEAVFSDAEITYLDAQDEAAWLQHFFSIWTLKEAYAKAVGLGLSAPLRQISFNIDTPQARVHFVDGKERDSAQWLFHCCKPTVSHLLAIAAKPTVPIVNIVCRDFDLSTTRL